MSCRLLTLCQYETNKLVRINSVRLGSLKWTLNVVILMFICIMMLWNKQYQELDPVVSSVTAKLKGVALTQVPGLGDVVWDVVDYSGPAQEKNSFFVVTNVIITKNQKQGKCAEVPREDKVCQTDKDCSKGAWDQHSHGVQTGACVKFDVRRKTCEVSAWCPVETRSKPPRPALLAAAENFTVLIKNNIRFPAFNYVRRNILPQMNDAYLRGCHRGDDALCPIFRLGDIVHQAREDFAVLAVEGGVIGIQINWDCNLDRLMERCLPKYSFRRLDEKESNRTLYPGLNFRFARYHSENGVEMRTLYKAFGIRFDVMVFGKAGKFSFIQLVVYIGSTLSYYALTTIFIDWLIGTSCYKMEARQNYSERKLYPCPGSLFQCILSVSFVDEDQLRLVRKSRKKSLQNVKPLSVLPRKENNGSHLRAMLELPKQGSTPKLTPINGHGSKPLPQRGPGEPAWCLCGGCSSTPLHQEELCCRRSRGPCITSSPLFHPLVLSRPLLEALLRYRDPLGDPAGSTDALRHCAYEQYIAWRLGVPPADSHPVVPRCCVDKIRAEFPSLDGDYQGFRPR
ncbi:P2X purinoceptor 7 isoform X1 [Gadus macrocephalus]|uniref:P2X purinoceptor 7 isoform X1 n=1 Tax=Gadus macrocephalus TaxID=80720 RepID=UPI0028CB3FCE|nr:P2X purinoceptor 7 isoform X1 [Gadus macrocephalus]